MAAHEAAAVQALRFSQTDVVAVDDLDHLVAREARDGRHREQAHGDDRHDGGLEELRGIKEIGEKRNLVGEIVLQEDQKDIRGNADAQDGDDRAEAVEEASAVERGTDAQQQADDRAQQHGHAANAEGVGDTGGEHGLDRRAVVQRGAVAEVAVEQLDHIVEELDGDGIVQAHLGALVGDLLVVHPLCGERIAGHDANEHEEEKDDDQQGCKSHADPLEDIFCHRIRLLEEREIRWLAAGASVAPGKGKRP